MDFILNAVTDPVCKKISHLLNLEENMSKLKRSYEELNCRKEDVEMRIKGELGPGKWLKKEVRFWLADVERIEEKRQRIVNEVGQRNYFRCGSQGEHVANLIQEVEVLHQKGGFSDSLVLDAPPLKGGLFPPKKLAGGTTTVRKINEIWDFLMDDETGLIGVYGIGGVGKTTVMRQINNRLVDATNNKFDNVIWITLPKVHEVRNLQDVIAKAFGVDISGCRDETERAMKLSDELGERERFVLVLDDVWDAFELEKVGIPEPSSANGCKLVLTTRSFEVCRYMNCKGIKMELLSEDEAWSLFLDTVGRHVLITPNLEATMKLVAEECACLPLAIITIAGSMKGRTDECEWRNALSELREAAGVFVDIEKVLKQLEYSYLRLEDQMFRQCFLYCALYPEGFEIERKELIKYWMDEGILESRLKRPKRLKRQDLFDRPKRQDLFDRGHSVLNKLEEVCLLESVTKDYDTKYVKMHDLIRDMALRIMGRKCMVKADVQLRELPYKEQWTGDLERVSLMNNDISEIHSGALPMCRHLSTLLLLGNGGLRRISDDFFHSMDSLKVLDLSHTGIEILPDSISGLTNLTSLLLRWCPNLKYVPSLAHLMQLYRLDLCGSGIEEVPKGLRMLKHLKYLNLNAQYLKVPAGILCELRHLQCLIIWWASKTLKISGSELTGLRSLETLAVQFEDVKGYNTFLKSRSVKPQRYLLQVGPHGDFLDFDEQGSYFSKYVVLTGCAITDRGGEEFPSLPMDIQELEIKECHDMESLYDALRRHKITHSLKYCKIVKCHGIESVIPYGLSGIHPVRLEVLRLEDLPRLHVLFKGDGDFPPPPPIFECFSQLKEVHISNCPKVRKLFVPVLLPNLKNLEEINIRNCSGVEEIIASSEQRVGESSSHSVPNNDDSLIAITLPKLKRFTLEDLPELKTIVWSGAAMVCESLQILTLLSCPKLKRVPLDLPKLNDQPCPPPALLQIEINDREWWESMHWDPPFAKDVLEPFLLDI